MPAFSYCKKKYLCNQPIKRYIANS